MEEDAISDSKTLFALICKEEDADSKHIYFFLFKLLQKSIRSKRDDQTPTTSSNENASPLVSVEAHLGKPPFEEPSITKALNNFLFCKYGKAGDLELQHMFEACKLFLYCLNMWKFETPTMFARRQAQNKGKLFEQDLFILKTFQWFFFLKTEFNYN